MRLHGWIDEVFDLETFVEVCLGGFGQATNAKRWIEVVRKAKRALGDPDPFPDPDQWTKVVDGAAKLEKFGNQQMAEGFPYVHRLAAVRLWSILEAMVDDVVMFCLRHFKASRDTDLLRSLRGPLLEFLELPEEDRHLVLIEHLKAKLDSRLKQGIGKFESIFHAIGMSGGVEDGVRRAILELAEVRNLIIHKNSIADKRFCEACPWIGIRLGSTYTPIPNHYRLYQIATLWYMFEIDRRLALLEGRAICDEQAALQRDYAARVDEFHRTRPVGV